ncbi:copper chaperone PCu(A)C [Mycolicibacterium pulveris]|uniref:copper chaperone PCu(A)C n=1 Tax=Mycolicibacterium pulveris TaxID=36813 RepID=UPI003CF0B88A
MRSTKLRALGATLAVAALVVSGCTAQTHEEVPMAESVIIADQWASAADAGMAAVFGTFTNTGHHDAHIVSGNSPVAERVELHEVTSDATGSKTMREKHDGFVVPAGGTRDLVPGGDHLMLMDLREPLHPGADVEVTVVFEDGSTLPITAQIRDFAGADEDYAPAHHDHG